MTDKTKAFLQKLKDSGHWNDDYDYSKVEYVNSATKIIVVHRRFGTEHLMNPSSMVQLGVKCTGQNLRDGYRSFEDAKDFAKSLGLASQKEWFEYVKRDDFPIDVPKAPHSLYKTEWTTWGDWLGTGRVADQLKEYWPFEKARDYARLLKFTSNKQWVKHYKAGKAPTGIPRSPDNVYREKGWLSWPDFLGTKVGYGTEYKSFEEARKIVRSLNLKSTAEWQAYYRNGNLPADIPRSPDKVYGSEWISWPDWLGNKNIQWQKRIYWSFSEARNFVWELNLRNQKEWQEYCRRDDRPQELPSDPKQKYLNDGWLSWEDWLGTSKGFDGVILPFEEARDFARSLGLKSLEDWKTYAKSTKRPAKIPTSPASYYKHRGWLSWPDWLGNKVGFSTTYVDFEEAQEFAQSLCLKSSKKWKEYCIANGDELHKKGIPKHPQEIYKNKGWTSWGDWLGTGTIAPYKVEYRAFAEARKFARSLGLESNKRWRDFCKSGNKPSDIPANPDSTYSKDGWKSWGDWLGTESISTRDLAALYLPFPEARAFVHSLKLKSLEGWQQYIKSDQRPPEIPSKPNEVYRDRGWVGISDWLGYLGDGSHPWHKHHILHFVKSLETELTDLDSVELITIINSNNLAKKLKELGALDDLTSAPAGTEERKKVLKHIIDTLQDADNQEEVDEEEAQLSEEDIASNEFAEELKEGEVTEITETEEDTALKPFDVVAELKMYDNPLVIASLDDENVEFLMKNQLKKLWNRVLNNEVYVEELRKAEGGENFTIIKNWFFDEYKAVSAIVPPENYIFEHQPNLMQRLVSYRLIREKHYGNWSGTGAGKTLAAIFSGRLAEAKNTVIICNNATVSGWVKSVHQYFSNNRVYTKKFLDDVPTNLYTEVDKYDVVLEEGQNNYLVLNYETFQLQDGEYIVSELLKNNTIDYVILDEVQNVKQRDVESESTRRSVVNKLIIHSREKNKDLLVMAMSATPVINNLTEPKKLIELLSGEKHDDLETSDNVINGVEMYKALTRYGLRYRPNYNIAVNEEIIETDGTELSEQIRNVPKGAVVEFEKVLIETKLNSVKDKLKKGTLVYTHYVTELSHVIGDYIKNLGFSVGFYTGEDKMGLEGFKSGAIDVLVGSAPIGTGVDGIQYICNTLIPIVLPWTSAEYAQLVGRINRQGSKFDKVNIYLPQVVIPLDEGVWSWDKRRHNIIKFKATLADLAVDGRVPKSLLPPKGKLIEQAKQELADWIARLENKDIITFEREELKIPLNPKQIEYKRSQLGDFSELNKTWSTGRSENTHKRLKEEPSEWFYYHSLYSEKRKTWDEIPYMELAKKVKGRPDWIVADMGCGENLLSKEIDNTVHAFDHVAIDSTVTACDMSNVPLEDSSVDAVIFSLALMGSNYLDYLKEGYRILKPYGHIFISEPASKWEGREETLREQLQEIGFKVFEATRNTQRFIYIDGVKM